MERFYTGNPSNWRDEPIILPVSPLEKMFDPKGYLPDEGLIDAVNVALVLGQPLLVTGEPGTGKTLLAYSIACELGLRSPLKFDAKSTTSGSDIFYSFDALRQFRDASRGLPCPANDYITLNAMGKALVLANEEKDVSDLWPSDEKFDGPRRSVVLIDEIDKAPRDVPNDILNEIEHLYFSIAEANNRVVRAKPEFRPILVFTSNSEKHLPDTFLRRCVFYDIQFPDSGRLNEIVARRIEILTVDSRLIKDVIKVFEALRDPRNQLEKLPGTAELLNWVHVLTEMGLNDTSSFRDDISAVKASMTTLLKTDQDQRKGHEIIETMYGD